MDELTLKGITQFYAFVQVKAKYLPFTMALLTINQKSCSTSKSLDIFRCLSSDEDLLFFRQASTGI